MGEHQRELVEELREDRQGYNLEARLDGLGEAVGRALTRGGLRRFRSVGVQAGLGILHDLRVTLDRRGVLATLVWKPRGEACSCA